MLPDNQRAPYATIVADPPWPYEGRLVGTLGPDRPPQTRAAGWLYPTLTVEQIATLPVGELAAADAHLYLWTTQRYMRDSYLILDSWGFKQSALLVWSKPPKGVLGTFVCSTEFVLFARRGSLAAKSRHLGTCFEWPRSGRHSTKPEAFLDLVESVSPGPYLELFARRNRLGWDTWGNDSLEMVKL